MMLREPARSADTSVMEPAPATAKCQVCEQPVDAASSHVVLARSGEPPRLVHGACLEMLRVAVGA